MVTACIYATLHDITPNNPPPKLQPYIIIVANAQAASARVHTYLPIYLSIYPSMVMGVGVEQGVCTVRVGLFEHVKMMKDLDMTESVFYVVIIVLQRSISTCVDGGSVGKGYTVQ